MSEGMKPTRPERNIWHLEAGDARPDASSEPEPLIAPGSVVGLWLVEHLPVVHPHDHAFYEMALVLSGNGFHVCGDSEEPVQAGTVVFVPPGVAHGYRGCRDMEVYNCFFRAELSEFELLWAPGTTPWGPCSGAAGPSVSRTIMSSSRWTGRPSSNASLNSTRSATRIRPSEAMRARSAACCLPW